MAPSNKPRRRVGRTLRRARGGTTNAPLQAIEGNTVIALSSLSNATSSHFNTSPSKENPSDPVASCIKTEEPSKANVARVSTRKENGKEEGVNSVKYQQALQLLEEMEKEVERRCREIDMEVTRKVEELHSEVSVLRMLLPTAVQTMSPQEFLYEYDGKVANVLQKTKEQGYLEYMNHKQNQIASPTSTRTNETMLVSTVRSKVSRRSQEKKLLTSTPKMIVRAARQGEMAYSSNGSPLVPETIVQAPKGALTVTVQRGGEKPVAYLAMGGDTAIRLNQVDPLNEQGRAQLEAVQAMIEGLLRRQVP